MITYARILLTIILMMMTITGAEAMSFGMKKGFRFEDYKNAEDAQAVLLELYPVGSDVDKMIDAMEKAGAKCRIVDGKTDKVIEKVITEKDILYCDYVEKKIIFSTKWQVGIFVHLPAGKNIKEIQVFSHYETL